MNSREFQCLQSPPITHSPLLRPPQAPKDQPRMPGPSQINYTAIKWIWETSPEILTYLYSQCIEIGHYPTPFKKSTMVIIPKPKKNDYTTLVSFHPIQLLECLGKILNKILAHQIQYEVATNDLVPHSQFGGRIHLSTVDAGLSFTHDIHRA
jgi:hypothetical protein